MRDERRIYVSYQHGSDKFSWQPVMRQNIYNN